MRKSLKLAAALLILALFFVFVTPSLRRIDFAAIEFQPWYLVPAVLLLQVSVMMNALVVRNVFVYLRVPVRFRDAYSMYFLANLGRYVPGKVWQLLAMGWFAKRLGASFRDSSSLFILNQAAMIATALVYVIVLLALSPHGHPGVRLASLFPLVPLVGVLAFPNLLMAALNVGLGMLRRRPIAVHVNYRYMAAVTSLSLLNLLFNGLGFLSLALALGMKADDPLFLMAVYPLSYVVGYLSLIIPGGLGVRESMITFLLHTHYSIEMSGLLAVASLVWFMSNEACNGMLALLLNRDVVKHRRELLEAVEGESEAQRSQAQPVDAPRPRPTPPGKLKIVVLADPLAQYGPTLLADTLACPELYVSAVLLRRRSGRNPILRVWLRVARQSGWRYALERTLALLRVRLMESLPSARRKSAAGAHHPPDVETQARQCGVPVIPITNCNRPEVLEMLREAEPDVVVSAYFTQIIKSDLLNMPRLGCINVHPALLPQYRGSHPIFWALADGKTVTGVTVHLMDAGVDTGPIIAQERVAIESEDTHHALYERVSRVGARLLRDALLISQATGRIDARPQLTTGEAAVYGEPTPEAYRRFRRQGRHFV